MRYGEFPDVLFGKTENGGLYFDSTHYIAKKGDKSKHSIEDFTQKFKHWIEAVCKVYRISPDEVIIIDEATQHVLIDETLALLFIAYVDMDFCIYMIERVSELQLNGFALSDTCIMDMLKERFSTDFLLANMKQDGE